VNSLKLDIKVWNKKCEKFNDDLIMVQKAVDQKEEINKRHAGDHRRERQRLLIENDKLYREVQALREIHQNTLSIQKENKRLLDENDILINKVKLMMPVDSENPETVKRVHDIEVEKSLLRKENTYLERKDIQLSEEHKSNHIKILELEKEVETLKESNEKYLKQLLHANQKSETEAYKRLQEMLDKQKLHHYEDLVRQRDNIVSEYDARLSLYKDERDEAELKLKVLERDHSVLKVAVALQQNEFECMRLQSTKDYVDVDSTIRDLQSRLKLKNEEVIVTENSLLQAQRNAEIQKLENETLREKIDLMRQETNRLQFGKTKETEQLERRVLTAELKLKDYDSVAAQVDQVFSELAKQDQEWQGLYVKNVYAVPEGPQKLQAMSHVLKRLEQKVREVTILRKEMEDLKREAESAKHDREVALQSISGGPNPLRNLIDLVTDREEALKENQRVKERMEQDYHVLFRENQDMKKVI
jgi:hypothetical protein